MLRHEFDEALKRLSVLTSPARDDEQRARRTEVAETLWRLYGLLSIDEWQALVERVISTHSTRGVPNVSDFNRAHTWLKEIRGTQQITPQTAKCSACSSGLVITWLWHERYERAFETTKPCGRCSGKTASFPAGMIEISREEYVKRTTPAPQPAPVEVEDEPPPPDIDVPIPPEES